MKKSKKEKKSPAGFEKYLLIALVIFLLLFLFSPIVIKKKVTDERFSSIDAYYHLRVIEKIRDSNFDKEKLEKDPLIYSTRPYFATPYHYFLAFATKFYRLDYISIFFSVLFGILSVVFLYLILKRLTNNLILNYIILLIFISNPIFINVFTSLNIHAFSVLIALLGFYFFIGKDKHSFVISAVLFALLSWFNILNLIVVALILSGYVIYKKEKQKWLFGMIVILFLISFTNKNLYINYNFIAGQSILISLVSDFGSKLGIGIFSFILAIYGIFISWKSKNKFLFFVLCAIIIILFSHYLNLFYNIYLNIFVSVFAGIGFMYILKREWHLPEIKILTIFLLICGLMFSTLSYIDRTKLPENQIDDNLIDALVWLNKKSIESDVILSHPANGYLIEYFSHSTPLSDTLKTNSYSQKFNYKLTDSIFHLRDLKETTNLLKKYNIKFIVIDNRMKSGLVWDEPNQGLLFLLQDPDNFDKIYQNKGIEIWRVLTETK